MKKILSLIIFLWLSNYGMSQTNVYHPFPMENAIWNISYEDWWSINCYKYSYFTDGDTTINNISYHKIRKQGQQFLIVHPSYAPPGHYQCKNQILNSFNDYKGAIREDIAQKKVYIVAANSLSEKVLYDFNLNVGDTIKGYFAQSWSASMTIVSIDSTLVGSSYHKTWHTNPGWTNESVIIEGIGCLYGLLELPVHKEKTFISIQCLSVNNQTIYPISDSTSGCNILTSVIEEKKNISEVSLFPNPSNGKIVLVTGNKELNLFSITDILGNSIQNSEIINGQTEIDLSNYAQGIYFIQISSQKGDFMIKKIVKN